MKKGIRFVLISMRPEATQSIDMQDVISLLGSETNRVHGRQLKMDMEDVTRHYQTEGYDRVMLNRIQTTDGKKIDLDDIYFVIYGIDFSSEETADECLKKIIQDFAPIFRGRPGKFYRQDEAGAGSIQLKGYRGTHFDYLHRDIATTKNGQPEPKTTDTKLH